MAYPTDTVKYNEATCIPVNPSSITAVLNKKHCASPLSWQPNDLISINGFLMRAEAGNAMQNMMAEANANGTPLEFSSAYRSYTDQQATYAHWVNVNGSTASADTVSARPGFSEHQTGLVADLKVGGCALDCFASTPQYSWLKSHASQFGFIERYPAGLTNTTGYSPEAWHWRYVGTNVAQDMKQKNILTLEQYFNIEGGDYR